MSEDDDDYPDFVISPVAAEQLREDPAAAAAMEHFKATFRRAVDAVRAGKHLTLDDALNALGMEPVKLDMDTGEYVPGGSLHDDMGGDAVIAPNLKQTRN